MSNLQSCGFSAGVMGVTVEISYLVDRFGWDGLLDNVQLLLIEISRYSRYLQRSGDKLTK
jgi:hypothetical protein